MLILPVLSGNLVRKPPLRRVAARGEWQVGCAAIQILVAWYHRRNEWWSAHQPVCCGKL